MRPSIYFFLLFVFLVINAVSCKVADVKSSSQPITHEVWDNLLKEHVTPEGWVDYSGFQEDSVNLNKYIHLLESNHPNSKSWSSDERLAYWINAYNAFTIKLVSDHYPVESIKDIKNGIPFVNTVWDIKFINIEDQKYDLNNIEHGILRPKFNESRIHFAVNCASVSCPPLANYAYKAEIIEEQLEVAARRFISDDTRNVITSPDKAELSKIFSWFRGDFTKSQSLISFINQYSFVQLNENAAITHLDYNWGINSIEVGE